MPQGINFKNIIYVKKLDNSDDAHRFGNKLFETCDMVYLQSSADAADKNREEHITYATDYAVMCGARLSANELGERGRKSVEVYLRSANDKGVEKIDFDGCFADQPSAKCTYEGGCPTMCLSLTEVINAHNANSDFFSIVMDNGIPKVELGEFPNSYVGDEDNSELEDLFNSGKLVTTGKSYSGTYKDGRLIQNKEYIYRGEKYVRVITTKADNDSVYSTGDKAPKTGAVRWVKVEPLVWEIVNWLELPKEVNPKGIGVDNYIEIKTVDAIFAGIPFYPNTKDSNKNYWQNSTIRGYLNGINVNKIKTNGNSLYSAQNGGDFLNCGSFLNEALGGIQLEKTKQSTRTRITPQIQLSGKKKKGFGVTVETKPLTVKEQIKYYRQTGKSFMLHGPSGIGKTRRIEESDPNLVSIQLRKGMLPEEIIGKTIYPNQETTTGGIWVPPAWYISLQEKCKAEPDKNHILFIDEITNVSHEQGLVFHLVLNRTIQPNLGELPKNVVIVAAGNSREESEAAYNMTEPLFRRFDGHIYLKPDLNEWLEWGSEPNPKRNGQPKIHPLVSRFVATYGDTVFYSAYDSENPPMHAIDPRGWEQVSDIIYDNNGIIRQELIENKVGEEIADTFIAFAQLPLICLEDILEGNYDKEDLPRGFDISAKYAMALSLRGATEQQVEVVRDFISHELGQEILALYDSIWIGDDMERAIYISNLGTYEAQNNNTNQIQFKCTLDEFLSMPGEAFIHCDVERKANMLMLAFDRAGKKWIDGERYMSTNSYFEANGAKTAYSNKGNYATEDYAKQKKLPCFKFDQVDISMYLSAKEKETYFEGIQTRQNQIYDRTK